MRFAPQSQRGQRKSKGNEGRDTNSKAEWDMPAQKQGGWQEYKGQAPPSKDNSTEKQTTKLKKAVEEE